MKKGLNMPIMLDDKTSHQHALRTLNLLNGYQDFLDNVTNMADMGCGAGLDALWWATLDRMGTPRNIKVNAVDLAIDMRTVPVNENINYIQCDYTATTLEQNSLDLIWAHNSLQYSLSPFHTLTHWWNLLKNDGMLLITIPYNFSIHEHREIQNVDVVHEYNSYYNWSLGNLIMLLVANGFDCRNAHFNMDKTDQWIQAAVYKLPVKPPIGLSWYDMLDKKMLPVSIESAVNANGNFNESNIICDWIDRSQHILAL
jgi:SAM-dependent methyltransferase